MKKTFSVLLLVIVSITLAKTQGLPQWGPCGNEFSLFPPEKEVIATTGFIPESKSVSYEVHIIDSCNNGIQTRRLKFYSISCGAIVEEKTVVTSFDDLINPELIVYDTVAVLSYWSGGQKKKISVAFTQ